MDIHQNLQHQANSPLRGRMCNKEDCPISPSISNKVRRLRQTALLKR
uniref:Uncharacterized protein n=1 Tax=Anguilla anguilla TaxID=7936 RepID=A0A0E9VCY9_ANGAN